MWVVTLHSLFLYSVSTLMAFLMPQANFELTSSCINTLTILKPSHYSSYLPAYEDGTECSETSADKIQTPGNYPEENIQHVCNSLLLQSAAVACKFEAHRRLKCWQNGGRYGKCAGSLTCRAKPFHRHCVSDGDFLLVSLQAMTLHLASCNEQTKHSGPCYTGLHHSAANKACCSGVLIFPRPWDRVAESRARIEVASGVIGLASLSARPFPGGSWGQRMLFSIGFPHALKKCDL
jgi:hypothetical protein